MLQQRNTNHEDLEQLQEMYQYFNQCKKRECTITGLSDEPCVLLGQEKSSIWLFRRIPEGVTIPLPNGLFRELKQSHKKVVLV